MFDGCTSLTQVYKLMPLTLQPYCYANMYSGCTSLNFSATQTSTCKEGFRVPFSGTGTTASNALNNMLYNTGGTFSGTPNINTTYFTQADLIELWPTPIYELPASTTFNGTSTYIDTGLTLLDMDKDFCVFVDFQATFKGGKQRTLIHCQIESNPYPGFCIDFASNNIRYNYFGRTDKRSDQNRHKAIIVHTGGTTRSCTWYIDSTTGTAWTGERAYTNNTLHFLIGCYQTTSGTKDRFFQGTIYDLKVYDGILSQSQINALMS